MFCGRSWDCLCVCHWGADGRRASYVTRRVVRADIQSGGAHHTAGPPGNAEARAATASACRPPSVPADKPTSHHCTVPPPFHRRTGATPSLSCPLSSLFHFLLLSFSFFCLLTLSLSLSLLPLSLIISLLLLFPCHSI